MSNQPKHTPGPWRVVKSQDNFHNYPDWSTFAVRDARNCCLLVLGEVDHLPAPENKANARLIAAAPDLLAALENALETLTWAKQEKGAAYQYAAEDLTAATSQLSQALAKAKGQ